MKYKAFLALLDYPSPISGDIFPLQVVEEAIEKARLKLDGRLLVGALFDDLDILKIPVGKEKSKVLTEEFLTKRNLHYFKIRSNNISHIIVDLYTEDDNWIAEIETLPTGKGLKLEALLNREKKLEELVKFRPIVVRESKDGVVSIINQIVSIDAIIRETN